MTRKIVYGTVLVAFIAASAMTLSSILTPKWLSYRVATSSHVIFRHDGLHQTCSNAPDAGATTCRPFPRPDKDCAAGEAYFCSMWRTTGFLMSFAAVLELAAVVSCILIMTGGKTKREQGWPILGGLLAVVTVLECCAMGIVTYLFDHDAVYLVPDWSLGDSWILCTVSAGVVLLCGTGLAVSASVLPPEDGYEFLRDRVGV